MLDFVCFSGNKTAQVLLQSGPLASAAMGFPTGEKTGSVEATIKGGFVLFVAMLMLLESFYSSSS